MVISLFASGLLDGKNQNHNWFGSVVSEVIGSVPAYDSPILKSTSGKALSLTEKSSLVSASRIVELEFPLTGCLVI
jgi:hypothetical protein